MPYATKILDFDPSQIDASNLTFGMQIVDLAKNNMIILLDITRQERSKSRRLREQRLNSYKDPPPKKIIPFEKGTFVGIKKTKLVSTHF